MTVDLPIIVGISGASGVIYGVRLLRLLRDLSIETYLVLSRAAEITIAYETNVKIAEIKELASEIYPQHDIGAAISSGSFKTRGMIIAPCSIKTMAEIATGVTSTLLTRAADVVLKERRRLVVMISRSSVARRSFAHHDLACGNGRDYRSTDAGVLSASDVA